MDSESPFDLEIKKRDGRVQVYHKKSRTWRNLTNFNYTVAKYGLLEQPDGSQDQVYLLNCTLVRSGNDTCSQFLLPLSKDELDTTEKFYDKFQSYRNKSFWIHKSLAIKCELHFKILADLEEFDDMAEEDKNKADLIAQFGHFTSQRNGGLFYCVNENQVLPAEKGLQTGVPEVIFVGQRSVEIYEVDDLPNNRIKPMAQKLLLAFKNFHGKNNFGAALAALSWTFMALLKEPFTAHGVKIPTCQLMGPNGSGKTSLDQQCKTLLPQVKLANGGHKITKDQVVTVPLLKMRLATERRHYISQDPIRISNVDDYAVITDAFFEDSPGANSKNRNSLKGDKFSTGLMLVWPGEFQLQKIKSESHLGKGLFLLFQNDDTISEAKRGLARQTFQTEAFSFSGLFRRLVFTPNLAHFDSIAADAKEAISKLVLEVCPELTEKFCGQYVRLLAIYSENVGGLALLLKRFQVDRKPFGTLIDIVINYHGTVVIPEVMKAILMANTLKLKGIQSLSAGCSSNSHVKSLAAAIIKLQAPRELFQYIVFSRGAIIFSHEFFKLANIGQGSIASFFPDFFKSQSFFLAPDSKEDYFKRDAKGKEKYGKSRHLRGFGVHHNNIQIEIKSKLMSAVQSLGSEFKKVQSLGEVAPLLREKFDSLYEECSQTEETTEITATTAVESEIDESTTSEDETQSIENTSGSNAKSSSADDDDLHKESSDQILLDPIKEKSSSIEMSSGDSTDNSSKTPDHVPMVVEDPKTDFQGNKSDDADSETELPNQCGPKKSPNTGPIHNKLSCDSSNGISLPVRQSNRILNSQKTGKSDDSSAEKRKQPPTVMKRSRGRPRKDGNCLDDKGNKDDNPHESAAATSKKRQRKKRDCC